MSDHAVIVVTSQPVGRFLEGTIEGDDILPGTMMVVKPGQSVDARGRLTWIPFDGSDGERRMVAILREKNAMLMGGGKNDAYEDGEPCHLYCPIMGDEVQVRVSEPGTGTGDSFAIGDRLIVNGGDGTFIRTTGTPESEPFEVAEEVSDVEADGTLVLCYYTGH